MTDYSFDLETLGTGRDSYILSIGCAEFNRYSGDIISTYYQRVKCHEEFRIDYDTVEWWLKQSDEARAKITENKGIETRKDIGTALIELYNMIPTTSCVWGNGAAFDISLLEDAYKLCAMQPSWEFWNIRDMRTIVDVAECKGFDKRSIERVGTHHNALDDAIHQAKVISAAFQHLIE